ncbi:hypothetical protein K449DRAFT_197145 [Hypoxylon sp. EC38]|nr:hypothetical protein K449DRAFT_197145 [Hypoxylon sp. EC38]
MALVELRYIYTYIYLPSFLPLLRRLGAYRHLLFNPMASTNINITLYSAQVERLGQMVPESAFYFRQLLNVIRRDIISPLSVNSFEVQPVDGVPSLHKVAFAPQSRRSTLVVVEGHISPTTLCELGNQFKVRPEFFLGHLDCERVLNRFRTSFEIPALPSRRDNLVHVRLISLWRAEPESIDPSNLKMSDRSVADNKCKKYERDLLESDRYGTTRFRRVHMHNSKYFSVEQMVSFFISRSETNDGEDKCFKCIFLLDSGRAFDGASQFPWNIQTPTHSRPPTLLHAVKYNEQRIANVAPREDQGNTEEVPFLMHPFHPGREMSEPSLCRLFKASPLAPLSVLFSTASLSWNHELNFIADDIDAHNNATSDHVAETLAQIRFNMSLIHRFHRFIEDDHLYIQDCIAKIFSEETDDRSKNELKQAFQNLHRDYQFLNKRCSDLLQQCESSTGLLQSTIEILESQKSVQQATEVNKLTRLAFIFIPVSLAASVFGINVFEINGSNPTIWHFCITAVLCALIGACISSKDPLGIYSMVKENFRVGN